MIKHSTHIIQLKPEAPLTVGLITSMTFEVFQVGASEAIISKSLTDGIEENSEGWLITITAEEINFNGQVQRQLKYVSEGKSFVNHYEPINIENTK